jgi:hypothetical protein
MLLRKKMNSNFVRSRLVAVSLVLCATLSASVVYGTKSSAKTRLSVVTLQLTDFAAGMKKLRSMDADIAGVNLKLKKVDVVASDDEMKRFSHLEGVKAVISLRALDDGPDPQYKSPDQIEKILTQYHAQYPAITEMKEFGKSLEGRSIWALKISKPSDAPKPAILFNGMHHAREVMGPEVPLDVIDQLLTQYGKDPKVTHWVDADEIWVVPMLNVDGNNKVWTGSAMWRKNSRGGYGVDINRNYPYAWASCNGSSDHQNAEDFHGASAGSEPETQALMSLVDQIRPVFDISYHSYSELVIYPYGCNGQHAETKEVVEQIGQEIAALLPSDEGSDHYTAGTAWETLYDVDGDDVDWMYHEKQVLPYVIELNSMSQGFQPGYADWRDKTVTKLRAAWQHLLERMDSSSLRGTLSDADGKLLTSATVQVERENSAQPYQQTYTVNPNGTYHLILNPGTYRVNYRSPGFADMTKEVVIQDKRVDEKVLLHK